VKTQLLLGPHPTVAYLQKLGEAIAEVRPPDDLLVMDGYNRSAGKGSAKRLKKKWLLVSKSHPHLERLRSLLDAELLDPIVQLRKIGVRI
jgi:hypothetical protein